MRYLLFSISLFLFVQSKAQQISQYSQWSFHQFNSNPAHAGIKQCVDIHSLHRSQWVGFEGAPNSGFFTLSVPVNMRRRQFLSARQGIGAKFEYDRLGQFAMTRINLAYAAHFNFNQNDRLSLGLYGGILQTGFDANSATTLESDPTVLRQSNFVSPDFTFGAWYNSLNYYFGLSLHNMARPKWKDLGESSRHRFHLKLNGAYRMVLNEEFTLLPGAMIRIPPRGPVSFDINLLADYRNTFGFGVGYRNTDALVFMANFKVKGQFTLVYSFDYTLSDIQKGANNTHEIGLRFSTCRERSSRGASGTDCPLFE